jgi:hypothetical protein
MLRLSKMHPYTVLQVWRLPPPVPLTGSLLLRFLPLLLRFLPLLSYFQMRHLLTL